jgi:hypothetical protein
MIHEEFVTWKNSELTQARFKEIEAIVESYKEEWANLENVTEKQNDYKRGIIAGLRMSMEEVDE